jgi:hypothetical protein
MATSTYLSNPVVTVNSVDLTDQCTAATFTHRFDQLENTTFGKTARTYQAGLGNHEVTLDPLPVVRRNRNLRNAWPHWRFGTTTTVTVSVGAGERQTQFSR